MRRVVRRAGLAFFRWIGDPVVSPSTGLEVRDMTDDDATREFQRISRNARLQALRDFDHARGLPRQGALLARLDMLDRGTR